MDFPVITNKGADTGRKAVFKDAIFDAVPHEHLVYRAVVNMQSRKRQGTASTKCRSEIRGSTRKLRAQKGSGFARRGSANAGILRGGATMGPRPSNYNEKMNKREKAAAFKSGLVDKQRKGQLLFVEDFQLEAPSTKKYIGMVSELGIANEKVLWVAPETRKNLVLSARNVPKNKVTRVDQLNIYDLLYATRVVVLEGALDGLQKKLA